MIDANPRPEDFEKHYIESSRVIADAMPQDSPYLRDCHIAKMLARAYKMTEAEASERIGKIKSNGSLKIDSTDSHKGQKPKMTGKVRYMTDFNVSGSTDFEKVKMEHESRHPATIKEVKDIKETKDFEDPSKIVEKIPILFEVGDKELISFVTNKITKGSGTYSNSKLYDFLDKSGKLDAFVEKFKEGKVDSEEVLKFLKDNLVGRRCEIEIHNAKKGKEDEYSTVGKIVKFTDLPAEATKE